MAKRRQDDEVAVLLRANAQAEAHRQAAGQGPSIREQYWMRLDEMMDWMMVDGLKTAQQAYESGMVNFQDWAERRGRAQGLAEAIAIMDKAIVGDIDGVREMAMERWQARQPAAKPTRRKARRA